MIPGFVGQQIRRTNRNLLIANLILIAIVAAITLCCAGYLIECVKGPFPTTLNDLAQLKSPDAAPHKFITFPIDQNRVDPAYYQITGGSNHQNDYYHFLHLDDGRFIVANTHSESVPDTFTGSISDTGGDIQNQVLPGIADRVQGSIANFSLDTDSYRFGMYVLLVCGIPALALAFWNIAKFIKRTRDPLTHPTAKELAKIGPPEEIAVAVDAEIQAGAQRVKKVLLTTSWLAYLRLYAADLVYLGDVAWAYKQETKHKQYGITVNKTYATILHDVRGRKLTIPLSQKQVESVIAELGARVPWAYVGFDQRLKTAWEKQRPQFLATVEQRKQQCLNPNPPPAPAG